ASGVVEDVVAERLEAAGRGVAEVVEPVEVLGAAQQRVVVVRRVVDASGRDVRGDQNRAGAPAAAALGDAAVVRRVRAGGLTAAGFGSGAGLVEVDDDQAPVEVGRGGGDPRDPRLEEVVGAHEAAGPAVGTRRVVAVAAEVGCDEGVAGGGRRRAEVALQL